MSYRRWKSFVVAIRDIEHPPGVLLSKAARIAQRFGGRLELLHVIALPYVLPGDTAGREFSKDAEIARQLTKLERMAKRLRKIGIDVKCSVVWDYPAADAIVRHVLNTRPDVVLAESHHHSKLSRWFVTHTDWELIRSCPCPLWLIKTSRLMDDLRVLAAVDPLHAHSKPAALDEEILRAAQSVAAESGRVGVAHIYAVPITMVAGGLGEPIWVAAPASEMRQVRQQVTRAVDALAERYA
ncbi:MAG: universal stress protein, partial [Candidatus Obscuribacterales bacterium]|nr:universal stress protein [Steroidobacteraceae bacterium]